VSYKAALPWILAGGLSLASYAQNATKSGPVPRDPLEMVTGQASAVDTAGRTDALRLLERARGQYALRSLGRGYDLKVTFTVASGGQTQLDGLWHMEDVFDPKRGLRWTAKAPDGSVFTRIASHGMVYGEDTGPYVPLRLQEARAALFDPMPAATMTKLALIRTSTAVYQGSALACVLISWPGNGASMSGGRQWDEAEECIDAQSGLLRTHSQAPGRYFVYDYSSSPQLGDRMLPRQVTVTEGGHVVSTITVESLSELRMADPGLFAPTEEMKSKGRPVILGGAQRISRSLGPASSAGSADQTVCVFGLVTAAGQLVEAHSLQPANPNSAAALAAVRQMSFERAAAAGEPARQYFVFVIGKFVGQ